MHSLDGTVINDNNYRVVEKENKYIQVMGTSNHEFQWSNIMLFIFRLLQSIQMIIKSLKIMFPFSRN